MKNERAYDLIVIGGGAGGSACTAMAAEAGYRVAQIERDHIGGTCLNYGCDPTKTMLHIGELFQYARAAEQYGLQAAEHQVAWDAVLERVRAVQDEMRGGPPQQAQQQMRERGIDLILGEATFIAPHEIDVAGRRLTGKRFLIATGTEPLIPDIPGLHESGFITNREAVSLPCLPTRLAVIGSGPVGTEFAQLFHNFGVQIALFDESSQILPKDDAELAAELSKVFDDTGIEVKTGLRLTSVESTAEGKKLTFTVIDAEGNEGEKQTFTCDELLLALGRRPSLQALQLENAGVATADDKVVVDQFLRTSVPHIWAAGDIATDYPFTHTGNAQSHYLADAIFAEEPQPFNNNAIPWVTYTRPALAHVGKTEKELQEAGTRYQVARQSFADVARAQTTGEKTGQVKILVGDDGELLGAHILAVGAGDLIAPLVLAMRTGLQIDALQDVILPYPTMVGAIRQAARSLK